MREGGAMGSSEGGGGEHCNMTQGQTTTTETEDEGVSEVAAPADSWQGRGR